MSRTIGKSYIASNVMNFVKSKNTGQLSSQSFILDGRRGFQYAPDGNYLNIWNTNTQVKYSAYNSKHVETTQYDN